MEMPRNPESVQRSAKKYYLKNRQEIMDRKRQKRHDNPHIIRQQYERRNAGWQEAPMRRRRWSPVDDVVVLGVTTPLKDVAEFLGRSPCSVDSRRRHLIGTDPNAA